LVFWWRVGTLTLSLLFGANAAPCHAEWVVAVYGGGARTSPSDLRIQQPSEGTDIVFPSVRFDGKSLESPVYYGYRVARSLPGSRRWYVEAEFIHAKVYARGAAAAGAGSLQGEHVAGVPFPTVVQGFAMSHGLNFILFNVVLRQRVLGERLTLSARGGAGPTLPHAETEIEGERREQYELAGAAYQASGGVEVRLWRQVGAIAEYKWTGARPRLSVAGGAATLTTRSHHLAVGLAASF
jgi:hypothetical protein